MLCRNWLQPVPREAVGAEGGGGRAWTSRAPGSRRRPGPGPEPGEWARGCPPSRPRAAEDAQALKKPDPLDLVKSHLMYAVREEVEVLKEQIKELIEKNSQLEQENNLLKTLASPEQLAQFQAQLQTGSPPATTQPQGTTQPPAQPASQGSGPTA
ncbi:TSC22 domain family protein 1 isoform X5 [Canis lupus dingo]|uniref:TSC22 domain family protein 1 isoform X5 n=1 Tax=Canis lupus dingo TaxID=286419 RepID=UPI000DC68B37|nr:TSC22 domain family protein 1 isoform X5 [Canis lupus dingo]